MTPHHSVRLLYAVVLLCLVLVVPFATAAHFAFEGRWAAVSYDSTDVPYVNQLTKVLALSNIFLYELNNANTTFVAQKPLVALSKNTIAFGYQLVVREVENKTYIMFTSEQSASGVKSFTVEARDPKDTTIFGPFTECPNVGHGAHCAFDGSLAAGADFLAAGCVEANVQYICIMSFRPLVDVSRLVALPPVNSTCNAYNASVQTPMLHAHGSDLAAYLCLSCGSSQFVSAAIHFQIASNRTPTLAYTFGSQPMTTCLDYAAFNPTFLAIGYQSEGAVDVYNRSVQPPQFVQRILSPSVAAGFGITLAFTTTSTLVISASGQAATSLNGPSGLSAASAGSISNVAGVFVYEYVSPASGFSLVNMMPSVPYPVSLSSQLKRYLVHSSLPASDFAFVAFDNYAAYVFYVPPCPAGSMYWYREGYMPGCATCPRGQYGSLSAFGVCQLCPAGTYSTATGATSISTCQPCPAGTRCVDGSPAPVIPDPTLDSGPVDTVSPKLEETHEVDLEDTFFVSSFTYFFLILACGVFVGLLVAFAKPAAYSPSDSDPQNRLLLAKKHWYIRFYAWLVSCRMYSLEEEEYAEEHVAKSYGFFLRILTFCASLVFIGTLIFFGIWFVRFVQLDLTKSTEFSVVTASASDVDKVDLTVLDAPSLKFKITALTNEEVCSPSRSLITLSTSGCFASASLLSPCLFNLSMNAFDPHNGVVTAPSAKGHVPVLLGCDIVFTFPAGTVLSPTAEFRFTAVPPITQGFAPPAAAYLQQISYVMGCNADNGDYLAFPASKISSVTGRANTKSELHASPGFVLQGASAVAVDSSLSVAVHCSNERGGSFPDLVRATTSTCVLYPQDSFKEVSTLQVLTASGSSSIFYLPLLNYVDVLSSAPGLSFQVTKLPFLVEKQEGSYFSTSSIAVLILLLVLDVFYILEVTLYVVSWFVRKLYYLTENCRGKPDSANSIDDDGSLELPLLIGNSSKKD